MTEFRYVEFYEKLQHIGLRDDLEALMDLLDEYPDKAYSAVTSLVWSNAKKCLTGLARGDLDKYISPPEDCATWIHWVARCGPHIDIIKIMLMRGGVKDLNLKQHILDKDGIPLEHVIDSLISIFDLWSPGDSVFKLVILLCQWEFKPHLDAALLIATASHTDLVRDLAWTFFQERKLIQLAALLLVAREQVMVPDEKGTTIQQNIASMMDDLHVDLVACELIDVFEKAGDALSLYCKSMCKQVPKEKVLVDVVGILQKTGFVLGLEDIDLRDCYRGCCQLRKPHLYKLANPPRQNNKYNLFLYPTVLGPHPVAHWDPLINRFKLGQIIPLASSLPTPQLLSTLAARKNQTSGSSVAGLQHVAHAVMKLKRRIIRIL